MRKRCFSFDSKVKQHEAQFVLGRVNTGTPDAAIITEDRPPSWLHQ